MSPALGVALLALAAALGAGLYAYRLRWGRLHRLGERVDRLEREREYG